MTVQELLEQILPRLRGPALCPLLDAVREVQAIITNRLLIRGSSHLKKVDPAELMYVSGERSALLPADFKELDGRPYLLDGRPLAPLGHVSPATLATPGTPKHFDRAGRSLRIYPVPDEQVTVLVPYYFNPPILTAMDRSLPFAGEFDSVFIDGCLSLAQRGLSAVSDKTFVAALQHQVDVNLDAKAALDEQSLADEINDEYGRVR